MNRGRQIAWARFISEAGDMFRILAFPLAVIAVRQDPRDLAWSETLGTLGMFFGSLLAPLVIDRVPRLRALVVSDLLALLCTGTLAIGIVQNSLPLLFAAYFVSRALDSFHYAALDAATTDLLVEERKPLVAGFSHLQLFLVGGAVIGGLAAAQVVTKVPLWALLVVDALSFVVASTWIYFLAGHVKAVVKPWAGFWGELTKCSKRLERGLQSRRGRSRNAKTPHGPSPPRCCLRAFYQHGEGPPARHDASEPRPIRILCTEPSRGLAPWCVHKFKNFPAYFLEKDRLPRNHDHGLRLPRDGLQLFVRVFCVGLRHPADRECIRGAR